MVTNEKVWKWLKLKNCYKEILFIWMLLLYDFKTVLLHYFIFFFFTMIGLSYFMSITFLNLLLMFSLEQKTVLMSLLLKLKFSYTFICFGTTTLLFQFEGYCSGLGVSPYSLTLVTDGQLPLRQCLHPEAANKDITLPLYYNQFADLRKEVPSMYASDSVFTNIADILTCILHYLLYIFIYFFCV